MSGQGEVSLHMTATEYHPAYDEWTAFCRCGWFGSYLRSQVAARAEGDEHLAEANGQQQ